MPHDASASPVADKLRELQQRLGGYAHSAHPAYTLAGLCAAAMPFGLGHAARTAGQKAPPPRLVPPFWQLLGFGVFFAAGGYMVDAGDVLNGSGVVTAWSLTYLTFKTLPVARHLPRSPVNTVLSASIAALGLGIYGSYYFDQASWRGAIPGLIPPQTQGSGGKERAL
ncbi:hypothetical protein MSPP1_003312 [Malassezia sp. CBS 17886]|nr:hypothetical protein MSPP1_003312 [Malassezia sp. CBS 17886]